MVKHLKLINDFYYCRPGKGALSSNTCFNIRLTKTTAAQNDDALSYHRVRGLCFQAVVFVATIVIHTTCLVRNYFTNARNIELLALLCED